VTFGVTLGVDFGVSFKLPEAESSSWARCFERGLACASGAMQRATAVVAASAAMKLFIVSLDGWGLRVWSRMSAHSFMP
jgi:hypothetical protein